MLKLKTYETFKLDPHMDIITWLENTSNGYEYKCNKFCSVFPNGLITSCDAMREVTQDIRDLAHMFQNIKNPAYVDNEIAECESCDNLSICGGGCPPLKNRYRNYNKSLLSEYCNYRVTIRNFLNRFTGKQNAGLF
jgi:radical SAM protein with 4Fe4S-binding SPASM domain